MKKVGIFTIQDSDNYGNRLQNFALQETIKQLGFECYSFANYRRTNFQDSKIKIIIIKNLVKFKSFIGNLLNHKRFNNFKVFNKNIEYYDKEVDYNNYQRIFNDFDYIVAGSDQVWNRDILRLSNVDLLEGIPRKKCVAYAASFGTTSVQDNCKNILKKNLVGFNFISVRETAGKEIIKSVANIKNVDVLVDPTMLIDCKEWEKLAEKPDGIDDKKYILNYFLSPLSDKNREIINKFASEKNWEIIDILDKKNPFYKSGPAEFLWLEKNAELICTDSFHSSVFALLFGRPFLVFNREDKLADMSSRLDTLLERFGLKERRFNGVITDDILNCDYDEAYKILGNERKKSLKFLGEALKNDRE
ncbi:polysaccharide pyruvyl transferase family protein [Candidatus Saccharibacteria bacterium]|nr:polysaccharide pyruvyl transferase family protein [Candidatus Saccharibacteria bacterium]